MKYKVGDKVRIDCPGTQYHGQTTYIRYTDVDRYSVDADEGSFVWFEDELIGTHKDCGRNDIDDLEHSSNTGAVSDYTSHIKSKKEKVAEVIKWLYINDRKFDSREQWKEELIKFLEEIL